MIWVADIDIWFGLNGVSSVLLIEDFNIWHLHSADSSLNESEATNPHTHYT